MPEDWWAARQSLLRADLIEACLLRLYSTKSLVSKQIHGKQTIPTMYSEVKKAQALAFRLSLAICCLQAEPELHEN